MLEQLPMSCRLIILIALLWGMWSAGIYLLVGDPKLEILAEFKDSVVFDSKRELPIIFSTD